MPKTKKISIITSDEIRITSSGNHKTIVHIDEPEIGELLAEINSDDIVTHIQSEGFKPDEIFSDEELGEWATKSGYIKE